MFLLEKRLNKIGMVRIYCNLFVLLLHSLFGHVRTCASCAQ